MIFSCDMVEKKGSLVTLLIYMHAFRSYLSDVTRSGTSLVSCAQNVCFLHRLSCVLIIPRHKLGLKHCGFRVSRLLYPETVSEANGVIASAISLTTPLEICHCSSRQGSECATETLHVLKTLSCSSISRDGGVIRGGGRDWRCRKGSQGFILWRCGWYCAGAHW